MLALAAASDHSSMDATSSPMRVTSGKSRVRESRLPGSVRAEPNGRATRPAPRGMVHGLLQGKLHQEARNRERDILFSARLELHHQVMSFAVTE